MPSDLAGRLKRILLEQRQRHKLETHNLVPRHKILLIGPPGSGKTMTAKVLAGELRLPLFTIRLETLLTKYMGETAAKLRLVFDSMQSIRGVYLFDEFDALGSNRQSINDIGEIRRILNSFLQFIEEDRSNSLIIGATNYPEMLDKALFRRFDDVLKYRLPTVEMISKVFLAHLARFRCENIDWQLVGKTANGLSQADVARSADDAAKSAVLSGTDIIETERLLTAVSERRGRKENMAK